MKKKSFFILLILIMIILIFVYFLNNRSFTNLSSAKKELLTYDYEISTNSNFKNFYVITLNNNDYDFEKYIVTENETLEIIIPKNKEFIISLYANRTINAKWNLEHDSNIIKFENMNWLEPNINNNNDSTGYSLARQYFYFNSKTEGNETLEFVYKDNSTDEEYFTFFINMKVLSK